MNFAIILHGNRAKLDELRRTDEFEAFSFNIVLEIRSLRRRARSQLGGDPDGHEAHARSTKVI